MSGATPQEMPIHECLDLVRTEPVGRLCVIEGDYPLAFPVNFKVVGSHHPDIDAVIRTAPETTIGRYSGNASLEVDSINLDRGSAWSVIMRGTLRPLVGKPGSVDPEPFVKTGRSRWMMLDVAAISGRRFVVRPDPDEFAVEWQAVAAGPRLPSMPPD